MSRFLKTVLLAGAALAIAAPSARAEDFYTRKLAQWGDPFTPPQTRVRCAKWASGSWPWGGGWKTCIGHAVDTKTMQCEVFAKVPNLSGLPAQAEKAARQVAEACAAVALAAGATAFAGTPSPELGGRIAAAMAVVQPAFATCVNSKGGAALAALAIRLDQSCGWSGWSNE